MAKVADQYANKFYGTVTETALNTLTFAEIHTNVNIFTKIAWILNRLEWYVPPSSLALIVATADTLEMALCASDNINALGLDNPSVIDTFRIGVMAPTDVTGMIEARMPVIRDFTNMPGGGIIIAPRPLYVAAKGDSLASAASVAVRGYFRQIEMKSDEYLELIDFYRIVS